MNIEDIDRISYRLSKEINNIDYDSVYLPEEILQVIQDSFAAILEEELEEYVEIKEEEE